MNNYGITTQRATSLFCVSKISFIYLMAPIDFTNEQNTLCRVALGYSYTLKMKINISVRKIWWVEACIYQEKNAQFGKSSKLLEHVIYREQYIILI